MAIENWEGKRSKEPMGQREVKAVVRGWCALVWLTLSLLVLKGLRSELRSGRATLVRL
jgi:hypothetical protein